METHYTVLGVHKGSAPEEIHCVYRKLASEYHPDKTQNDKEKTLVMVEVNVAYKCIGDVVRKLAYDAYLCAVGTACSACGGSGFRLKKRSFSDAGEKGICQNCAGCGCIFKN